MSVRHLVATACVAGALSAGCSPEVLPPPRAPARHLPAEIDVPADAPPPGSGRVILDANGERAQVVEALRDGDDDVVRPVCLSTPCVVDLPYGPHPLVFRSVTDESRQSETEIEVGPRMKVLRHNLGERSDGGALNTLGVSLLVLGTLAATTGGILWLAGASDRSASLEGPGRIVTGIGVGTMLLSLPLLIAGRPSERPGATTEWTLTGEPLPPGLCNPPRSVADRH
ncbi:MAG: hypothetical protein KF819_18475 [Labilithrix sp.]|nr:hypothetical protein [Labilithrix sp.]